jgi:tRNA G37 N-methylase TrmD
MFGVAGLAPREERLAGRVKQSRWFCFRRRGSGLRRKSRRSWRLDRMVLVCGRYEGVDERVADFLADREFPSATMC